MAFLAQIHPKSLQSSSKMDIASRDAQTKGLYFLLVGGSKIQGKDASKGKGRCSLDEIGCNQRVTFLLQMNIGPKYWFSVSLASINQYGY